MEGAFFASPTKNRYDKCNTFLKGAFNEKSYQWRPTIQRLTLWFWRLSRNVIKTITAIKKQRNDVQALHPKIHRGRTTD